MEENGQRKVEKMCFEREKKNLTPSNIVIWRLCLNAASLS